MKRLFVLLLFSVMSFAQTAVEYTATALVDNPPYGLVAQLWCTNPNGCTLDSLFVHAISTQTFDPSLATLIWGIGASNVEQPGCAGVSTFTVDTMNSGAQSQNVTGFRISSQPCLVNGQPYSWLNYTPTNFKPLATCWGYECSLLAPVKISPNTGVTLYTSFVRNAPTQQGELPWVNWSGHVSVTFTAH